MKNLKFVALISTLTILSFTNANANELLKPYVGINTSISNTKYFGNHQGQAQIGAVIGNTFNFGQFYVAPEFEFNALNTVLKLSDGNTKLKDIYAINFNFGYNINSLFGIFIGISENYMQVHSEGSSDLKFRFGYSLGATYKLSSNITTYAKYENKDYNEASSHIKVNQFTLGANYNF